VNENPDGALQSYLIKNGGLLSAPIDTVSSGGDSPATAAALSTGQVAVMNYGSGNGLILPTTKGGVDFEKASEITFPVPTAGEHQSHPHMAYQYGKEVFVPDLGADTVHRLIENGFPGNWVIHGEIQQPAGSGPRHIAIHNDILFTLHELSSTLTSQKIPTLPAKSSPLISNVSIIPSSPPSGASFAAGEILMPPTSDSFPTPFVYTSNRNTGTQDSKGDAIAIFMLDPDTGAVHLVNQVYTGLDQIRGMEFGGEDDKYLIAGGVAGTGGVVIFERTNNGADLREVVRNTDIPTATSFIWTRA